MNNSEVKLPYSKTEELEVFRCHQPMVLWRELMARDPGLSHIVKSTVNVMLRQAVAHGLYKPDGKIDPNSAIKLSEILISSSDQANVEARNLIIACMIAVLMSIDAESNIELLRFKKFFGDDWEKAANKDIAEWANNFTGAINPRRN